jgi:steroid delta-isomerase-like uncharacterized protein
MSARLNRPSPSARVRDGRRAGAPRGPARGGRITRDEIAALIDRWQTAVETRNADVYSRLYAETAVLESPLAGTVAGRDGLRRAFDAFFNAFPDASFSFEAPRIDGESVVVVCSIAGTHAGGFAGLPASGNPFRFSLVFLLVVRDGEVHRDRRIYDFTGLMVQIGMLKAKPRDR